jgi:hypothetical protein
MLQTASVLVKMVVRMMEEFVRITVQHVVSQMVCVCALLVNLIFEGRLELKLMAV